MLITASCPDILFDMLALYEDCGFEWNSSNLLIDAIKDEHDEITCRLLKFGRTLQCYSITHAGTVIRRELAQQSALTYSNLLQLLLKGPMSLTCSHISTLCDAQAVVSKLFAESVKIAPMTFAVVLEGMPNINAQDKDGMTMQMHAAVHDLTDEYDLLSEHGATNNVCATVCALIGYRRNVRPKLIIACSKCYVDRHGWNSLHYALWYMSPEVILDCLHDSWVTQHDSHDNNELHLFIARLADSPSDIGEIEGQIVKLLKSKCDPLYCNQHGLTPLDIVIPGKRMRLISYILQQRRCKSQYAHSLVRTHLEQLKAHQFASRAFRRYDHSAFDAAISELQLNHLTSAK